MDKVTIVSMEELDEQKRKMREKDAQDIASGKKTAMQVARENGFFLFPKVEIHYV